MSKFNFSRFWLILSIVLICSTAYFALKCEGYRASIEESNYEMEHIEYLLSETHYLKGLGWSLQEDSVTDVTLYDQYKNQVKAKEVLANGKLVFIFGQETCWPCVSRDLAFLDDVAKVIGKERIVIVGKRVRHDFLFKSSDFSQWRDNLYRSKLNLFEANVELPEMSMFVVTDRDSQIRLANYSSKSLDTSNELLLDYLKRHDF